MISVFRPVDAAPEAIGMPYIVFAGNVLATARIPAGTVNGRPVHLFFHQIAQFPGGL